MSQSKESIVEDALARVLADSYEIAARGTHRANKRATEAVARDEKILRDALFNKGMTGDNNYGQQA